MQGRKLEASGASLAKRIKQSNWVLESGIVGSRFERMSHLSDDEARREDGAPRFAVMLDVATRPESFSNSENSKIPAESVEYPFTSFEINQPSNDDSCAKDSAHLGNESLLKTSGG